MDDGTIQENINERYRAMNGMGLREMDRIICTVGTLCRDHQRSGFVEGVKNEHITAKSVVCLFKHEKQLFHPVGVVRSNPQYAALLQEQLGGGNGELKAAVQYR